VTSPRRTRCQWRPSGKSVALYKALLEEATDDNAKAFYTVLLSAERGHLQLLSKTQEFLDSAGHVVSG